MSATQTHRNPAGQFTSQLAMSERFAFAQRVGHAADVFGSNAKLAEWLGVSPSSPSRWIAGKSTPGRDLARLVIDIDYVAVRAATVWGENAVQSWLLGQNAFLGGASPLDMVQVGRTAEVVAALSGEASEVYA